MKLEDAYKKTMAIVTSHNFAAAILVKKNDACLLKIIDESDSLRKVASFVCKWLYEMAYLNDKDTIIKEFELKDEDLEDYPPDIF